MNRLTRSLPTSQPSPVRPGPASRLVRRGTARGTLARSALATVACLGLLFSGCSGGSDTGDLLTGGDFVVLSTQPETNGQLFLNDPIRIDFSTGIDLDSVDLTTFSFQVFDQLGNPLQENVSGIFRIGTSPGDAAPGRRLEFVPVFPTNDTFDNGGFKPGRTYNVQLVGGDRINGTVLRDVAGRALLQPVSFQFRTAEGTTPAQLFRNTLPGGPRRTGLDVTPRAEDGAVVLNRFGAPPVEIRLVFDQPINPRSSNIPTAFDPDPLTRNTSNRGNVFLEYDDPDFGPNWWIPASVELEANELDSSTLLLRPVGVLPNNATIRVIVESSVADISGESNVSNAAYDRIFGSFQTQLAYEQQFDALIASFDITDQIDFDAAFGEPVGEVGEGFVRAGFGFEGTSTQIEFEPRVPTVLNTDFTVVTPKVGAPYNVSGGIFNFASVNIPAGITVQGQGTNPMVWLVSGDFTVAGTLSVDGGNGEIADQVASANFPKAGGFGACGGGTGGDGSPSATERSGFGDTGNGPLEEPLTGGTGGTLACVAGCGRGSGGGGGSLATQGDPGFPAQVVPTGGWQGPNQTTNALPVFAQVQGTGGRGCGGIGGSNSRQLDGGTAGGDVFLDSRNDNDFWGTGINVRQGLRITGELSVPLGGGGGGGGGDLSYNNSCTLDDPNFNNDGAAGGGGGGGGVLIVKALGTILITDSGRVSADGGAGGGGEINGSSSEGGGGGAGAGGMVVLMSATGIEINAKGNGFGDDDYNFAISADGGVCQTGNFGSPIVRSKYPASPIQGSAPNFQYQFNYDRAPLGGFGGMGIVQLMAPPGPPVGQPNHNADNSNTILDDNIRVFRLGVLQTGVGKTNTLAWRGYPNQLGQLVDDFGNPTPTVAGDVRPQPALLPTPFAERSRLRSKWLDLGAAQRRALVAADDDPRGIIDPTNSLAGPTYEFAGLNPATGYIDFETVGETSRALQPTVGNMMPILATNDADIYRGAAAYAIDVAPASLGSIVNLYAGYEAELYDDNDFLVGSYRVLAHSDSRLRLSTESGPLAATGTKVQLRAKFYKVMVDGVETLGGTYPGSLPNTRVPTSNIRIGFAFHTAPGNGGTRYPAGQDTYFYNLDDPNVQEMIRGYGATFVQFDILFDSRFRSVAGDNPPLLNPDTSRPELHFLRLPFRF